jgi:hypothetical protein
VYFAQLGRKLDLCVRGSTFTGMNPFHGPGTSFLIDSRREILYWEVKSSHGDNLKEPVENSEDQLITEVSHRLSLVGQHLWKIIE